MNNTSGGGGLGVATIIVALGSWKEVGGDEALLKNKRLECIVECKREKKEKTLMPP